MVNCQHMPKGRAGESSSLARTVIQASGQSRHCETELATPALIGAMKPA